MVVISKETAGVYVFLWNGITCIDVDGKQLHLKGELLSTHYGEHNPS